MQLEKSHVSSDKDEVFYYTRHWVRTCDLVVLGLGYRPLDYDAKF